jgi:Domain of unknown function (DU1801)
MSARRLDNKRPLKGKASRPASTDAEAELAAFIDKFAPELQTRIRAVRKVLRQRLPNANELVYDNYNFFVIGYSRTERPSDSILSLVADAKAVRLAFPYTGSKLQDPTNRLQGSGSMNRAMPVASASDLKAPDVEALIAASIKAVNAPLAAGGKAKLIIKSVSAKQRPRQRN